MHFQHTVLYKTQHKKGKGFLLPPVIHISFVHFVYDCAILTVYTIVVLLVLFRYFIPPFPSRSLFSFLYFHFFPSFLYDYTILTMYTIVVLPVLFCYFILSSGPSLLSLSHICVLFSLSYSFISFLHFTYDYTTLIVYIIVVLLVLFYYFISPFSALASLPHSALSNFLFRLFFTFPAFSKTSLFLSVHFLHLCPEILFAHIHSNTLSLLRTSVCHIFHLLIV